MNPLDRESLSYDGVRAVRWTQSGLTVEVDAAVIVADVLATVAHELGGPNAEALRDALHTLAWFDTAVRLDGLEPSTETALEAVLELLDLDGATVTTTWRGQNAAILHEQLHELVPEAVLEARTNIVRNRNVAVREGHA